METKFPMVKVSRNPDSSADYICDGIDDDVQIQAAIDDMKDMGGGFVVLLDGNYTIAHGLRLRPGVYLTGEVFLKRSD